MFITKSKDTTKPVNKYLAWDCKDRNDYLLLIANDCVFSPDLVTTIANILGEGEDFDKLPAIILAIKDRIV